MDNRTRKQTTRTRVQAESRPKQHPRNLRNIRVDTSRKCTDKTFLQSRSEESRSRIGSSNAGKIPNKILFLHIQDKKNNLYQIFSHGKIIH